MRTAWVAVIAALALVAAACGNSDGDEPTRTPLSADAPIIKTVASGFASTNTPIAPANTRAAASPTTTASGDSVTIAVVGDVSLAREVVDRMEANGAGYPYALVRDLLANADITAVNLEGALTDRGEPWPKGYNFRTPPRFASGLADAGIDIVSLANNHTMDYGVIGLEDTIAALDAANVRSAGAGADATSAAAPVVIEAGGQRVAFVACAKSPTEGGGFAIDAWAAGEASPGLEVCSAGRVAAQVADARAQADFVIVLVHAGDEYVNTPNAVQRELAEAALAAGADAFIGAHAHVVQPIEQRGEQLVAWGLGNFIFDLDNVDLANIPVPRVSLVLKFTLTPGTGVTSFEALPVTLDDAEDRPRPATPDEAAALFDLIEP